MQVESVQASAQQNGVTQHDGIYTLQQMCVVCASDSLEETSLEKLRSLPKTLQPPKGRAASESGLPSNPTHLTI